jgi:hypothetical protein
VDLAGDIALEAADDLGLCLALGQAASQIDLGRLVPAQTDNDDSIQGGVGLPVLTNSPR